MTPIYANNYVRSQLCFRKPITLAFLNHISSAKGEGTTLQEGLARDTEEDSKRVGQTDSQAAIDTETGKQVKEERRRMSETNKRKEEIGEIKTETDRQT